MFIQIMTLLACKNHFAYSKMYYIHPFQNMSQKSDCFLWTQYMATAATQPEHNRILSYPVQNHESNPKLNNNKACCIAIVINLLNVDSHMYMFVLLMFASRTRHGVCVCLSDMYMEHGTTKTRFTMVTTMPATMKIRIACLIETNTKGPQWLPRGQQHQRQFVTVTTMRETRVTRSVSLVVAII
jgi:hypothetical protein